VRVEAWALSGWGVQELGTGGHRWWDVRRLECSEGRAACGRGAR
jgi:hypothetical protein